MSLVFAALTPHPPLLIPTVGKEALGKLAKTKQAMEKLEEEIYLSKAEVLVIFSPHGRLLPDAFTVGMAQEFKTDLREFGDLTTNVSFKGELGLFSRLRQAAEAEKLKIVFATEPALDHGVSVPLVYLTKHIPNATIVPIGFCAEGDDWKKHLDFGYLLKEQIMKSTKRVAVITSADLSHALTTDAPAGFNPAGSEFDSKMKELLATGNASGMLQLPPQLVHDAAQCGFRCCLMLMGMLRGVNYRYEELCYEAPFGVGYLTANFIL